MSALSPNCADSCNKKKTKIKPSAHTQSLCVCFFVLQFIFFLCMYQLHFGGHRNKWLTTHHIHTYSFNKSNYFGMLNFKLIACGRCLSAMDNGYAIHLAIETGKQCVCSSTWFVFLFFGCFCSRWQIPHTKKCPNNLCFIVKHIFFWNCVAFVSFVWRSVLSHQFTYNIIAVCHS